MGKTMNQVYKLERVDEPFELKKDAYLVVRVDKWKPVERPTICGGYDSAEDLAQSLCRLSGDDYIVAHVVAMVHRPKAEHPPVEVLRSVA